LAFTDCLQIFPAALESPLEGIAFVHAWVSVAEFTMALFVASIAIFVKYGSLKSTAMIGT
jgi:hypothetical protein